VRQFYLRRVHKAFSLIPAKDSAPILHDSNGKIETLMDDSEVAWVLIISEMAMIRMKAYSQFIVGG
jgi:hypothetical protein